LSTPAEGSADEVRITKLTRIELFDKLRALDMLARHLGMYPSRVLAVDDETVTYRYKDRAADRQRKETVSGHEFIRRFLQHVLPTGFHKVRYYGLWRSSRCEQMHNLRSMLLLAKRADPPAEADHADPPDAALPRHCPHCGTGQLTLLRRISPSWPRAP
jgi:hypothetical protein